MAREWQNMEEHCQFSLSDDENMAKALQEQEYTANDVALTDDIDQLTYQFQDVGVNGSTSQRQQGHVGSSSNASSHSIHALPSDGDIDTDTMSYEELNQLGESIGSVNKGLSERRIDQILAPKINKSRMKTLVSEKTECPICFIGFKEKDTLSTLPCDHIYHKECITLWLQDNKTCCVCTREFN
ncbi:PREDICTED: E3 ubiquitin ligase BIG BROTHER-like [Camelina sativa]|uniref:E3 ubiquitin ligase BIG BROTHER-like n=1 Tax=Camelina sativa TaxID=90675 RepID=A0ABM1QLI9_CAMSA|nr:PREDICTED: E3 ubiquitin ligase BIG BROTHER-like [Camelina sativa]